jgi:hypothetical protein
MESGGIYPFVGSLSKQDIMGNSCQQWFFSITVFLLYVTEVTKLLVAETNNYYDYNWYLDTFEMEDRRLRFLDVTAEIMSF